LKKYQTARQWVPAPVEVGEEGAEIGLLAYGSSEAAMVEARDQLTALGIKTKYLRIRAIPFAKPIFEFFGKCQRVYIIEQNRDGQMEALLRMEMKPAALEKIRSVRYYKGLPIDADTIVEHVLSWEKSGHEPSPLKDPQLATIVGAG